MLACYCLRVSLWRYFTVERGEKPEEGGEEDGHLADCPMEAEVRGPQKPFILG